MEDNPSPMPGTFKSCGSSNATAASRYPIREVNYVLSPLIMMRLGLTQQLYSQVSESEAWWAGTTVHGRRFKAKATLLSFSLDNLLEKTRTKFCLDHKVGCYCSPRTGCQHAR